MRFNPRSLKYNIWLYFILFALGLVCLVWFVQIVFTEQYYLSDIKANIVTTGQNTAVQYGKMMKDSVFKDDFVSYVKNAKEVDGIHVIITTKDYNGERDNIPSECYPNDVLLPQYFDEYGDIIRQVKEYALQNSKNDYEYLTSKAISGKENQTPELLVYSKIISPSPETDDNPIYMVLFTSLESVSKMLTLIQKQLAITSLIVIVVAFFISLIIASNLANPISNLTKTARKLARGDFSVNFNVNSYSEIKQLSDTLNYMKEELKKTSVLQRELLANVTHDLKTPLTMVKAYAEMIKDLSGEIKEKRDKHAQVIIDEADRLTMLVNDILNLSKVESNVDELDLNIINISALTLRVVDHFASFTEKNGYNIKMEIEPNLYAEIDAKKIEQVFYNLIGNAINYTGDNKTVEVFLSVDQNTIRFEVVDSGKGIDEDKIDTIWGKYYRASETHKRPVKGTGLGLSIVKAILDAHGLKYGVISKRGVGSNFFVEFPVEKEVLQ